MDEFPRNRGYLTNRTGEPLIETKQALKRIFWAVLVTIGNGYLAFTATGPAATFFKVTAGVLSLVVVAALVSLVSRTPKKG